MKKKILAFIFSLCLIIPCMFIFSACGDEPPTDDPTKWKTITEATCTEKGKKQRTIDGNLEEEEIPALGHNYGEWTTTLNETCTTNGSKQHTCGRCQNIETEIILAHHTLDGTTKFDEAQHWDHCTKCTEKVNAENHEFEVLKENDYLYYYIRRELVSSKETKTCSQCDIEIINNVKVSEKNITNLSYDMDSYNTLCSDLTNVTNNLPIELQYTIWGISSTNASQKFTLDLSNNVITFNNDLLSSGIPFEVITQVNNGNSMIICGGSTELSRIEIQKTESVTILTNTMSNNKVYILKFDNRYNLTYLKANESSELVREYFYTYDNYGYLIKEECDATNDTEDYIIEYKNNIYDSNGNRTNFDYYKNGAKVYSVSAIFNNDNKIINLRKIYAYECSNGREYVISYSSNKISNIKIIRLDNNNESYYESSYDISYTDNNVSCEIFLMSYTQTTTTNIPE